MKLYYIYSLRDKRKWLQELDEVDDEIADTYVEVVIPSYFKYIFRVDDEYCDLDFYVSEYF